MKTKIITFGNFKGGTGKTTNSCMIAYALSKLGKKVLLVDLDPQANATALLLLTRQCQKNEVKAYGSTLMKAIIEDKLDKIITDINDNLHLLPSFSDFAGYPLFLEDKYPHSQVERVFHLKKMLDKYRGEYDYIILDTPPTLSIYTDSAVVCSDGIVIVSQTQERSYVGAQAFVEYLQSLYDEYSSIDFDVIGVLPVLLKNTSAVDKKVLSSMLDTFGEDNVFRNVVKNMERLKRYDLCGIVDRDVNAMSDMHDTKVMALYTDLAEEFINRTDEIRGADNGID